MISFSSPPGSGLPAGAIRPLALALVVGRWHRTDRRSKTHRRTPSDWDADFKLHTARGTMYIAFNNDDLELISFPKELLKEASPLEVHYDSWALAGVPKVQVDAWIEMAITKAKKQV